MRSMSLPVLLSNFCTALLRANQMTPSGPMEKLPNPGTFGGSVPAIGTLVNVSLVGSNRTRYGAQFSEAQTTSFLSTVMRCVPGSEPAGVGGTWYSVTMPVRGSSLPRYGVRWLEYQMLPLESPATSWVASSTCGSSYSVTTTLVA